MLLCVASGTGVGCARARVYRAHNFSLFNFVLFFSLSRFVSLFLTFVLRSACGRVHRVRDSRIRRDDILFLRFYPFSWRLLLLSANFKSNCKMINGSHRCPHVRRACIECVSSIYVGNCFLIAIVANTEIGTTQLHVSIIVIC